MHNKARRCAGNCRVVALLAWSLGFNVLISEAAVLHDEQNQRVTLSDARGDLVLSLNYQHRCGVDRVSVGGRQIISGAEARGRVPGGVYSAVKLGGQWFDTRANIPTPRVETTSNTLSITGIHFGGAGREIQEAWRFTVEADRIVWQVDRTYPSAIPIQDTGFPTWEFPNMSTWTGALLGHGGVAWTKLFHLTNSSYGVHNGKVTFWNQGEKACLRIVPEPLNGCQAAVRFTRQPNDAFTLNYSFTEQPLIAQHDLSRFKRDRQDIWRPFSASQGTVSVRFTLSALDYDRAFDRGTFRGLNGHAIREICHTIARIGAVDELLLGSNGYYSEVAVLHEPWLAQLGLAINDPDYCRAMSETLDFQREHAIGSDGRVKSRWADRPGDEMPGTYDERGYYECQWGWLMDSQTSWVINVAEQFDFSGDLLWLQRQKAACERVLEFLLRRDSDDNGLVEMLTDSNSQGKGSDWIDVVWAAYENALVNAQLYWALLHWADCEDLLGDSTRSGAYRTAAARLKLCFNRSTTGGGFWDSQQQCYAYWRNRDGSVHGTNLVVPVNFSAIGYGLCDEPSRQAAILDRMEKLMTEEKLFFWPLCFTSYAKEEVHPEVNWPFPRYENGDIFLAWGELGTRAYAAYHPALALKYVKNVLAQYAVDGLAFQRFLRRSQTGEGNDILANNCSTIVGLYRNLYGIQPKYNRLYLEPHLAPELNDTRLKYWLRGKTYQVDLKVNDYAVSVDNFTLRSPQPFGVNTRAGGLESNEPAVRLTSASSSRAIPHTVEYFNGSTPVRALSVSVPSDQLFEVTIRSWPAQVSGVRAWSESCLTPGLAAQHQVSGLAPNTPFVLSSIGVPKRHLQSDASGQLVFQFRFPDLGTRDFRLAPGF
jgi:hypothetical protein